MNIRTLTLSKNRLTILAALFIGAAFFWTSSSYLSWTTHLSFLWEQSVTYMAAEVYGCLTQVVGVFLFILLVRYDKRIALTSWVVPAVMVLDGVMIIPTLLSDEPVMSVVWGIAMNIFHGAVAGYYITLLSCRIQKNHRGFCFGVGYAAGNIGSWLLSLTGSMIISGAVWLLLICANIFLFVLINRTEDTKRITDEPRRISKDAVPRSTCILAGAVVFLLALTNQFLFFFPAQAYLADTVILQFSHVFYSAGLIIAAIINDRKRVAGLVLAVVSLCFPLLSVSLYQLSGLLVVLSVMGYFVMGFYSVYRVVVFTDLYDADTGLLCFAPVGLLCGKAGEGIGAALGPVIGEKHIVLSVLTAVLFVVVIILAFLLYVRMYSTKPVTTVDDRVKRFCKQYRISPSGQRVLALLIEEMTNPAIAERLQISENTVKFHIRNILKATDCEKRKDVVQLFQSYK